MAGLGTRALSQREMQGAAGHRGHDLAETVGSRGGTWTSEGAGAGGNGLVGLRSGSESELGSGE